MKKFFKVVLGGAALAGTACGAVYFMKKVLGWDIFKKKDDDDDFDSFDDDIDDIGDDDDSDDREYVTLDMEEEDGESEKENLEQETDKAEETGVPVPEEPVTATE